MNGIKVVGTFKPKRLNQCSRRGQWETFVMDNIPEGLYMYGVAEFRYPGQGDDHTIQEWHQDLNESIREHTLVMVWANTAPTELKCAAEDEIVTPDPYSVVMFENDKWLHRQPPMSKWQHRRRCFGRVWLTRDHELSLNYFESECGEPFPFEFRS